MVNMLNRRARITRARHPGLLGGVLPAAPRGQIGMLHDYIEPSQRFIACPNQDVVYGLGFFDLDTESVVVQVLAARQASTCWWVPTGTVRCPTASTP
jgi:hypothetical protein